MPRWCLWQDHSPEPPGRHFAHLGERASGRGAARHEFRNGCQLRQGGAGLAQRHHQATCQHARGADDRLRRRAVGREGTESGGGRFRDQTMGQR